MEGTGGAMSEGTTMRTADAIAAAPRFFRVETAGGVATLLVDDPGERVNTIHPELMLEFVTLLDRLEKDPAVKAIVLGSGKPDGFVAGAKIELMQAVRDAAAAEKLARDGQAVFDRVERFPKPIVAAIHGAAPRRRAASGRSRAATGSRPTTRGPRSACPRCSSGSSPAAAARSASRGSSGSAPRST